jgi:hypothetical protein
VLKYEPTSESAYPGCPSIVNVPAVSLYVAVILLPPTTKAETLSSTLSFVKYKLVPSLRSDVLLAAMYYLG